ncbi:MAG TPA: hypothetical protein DCZ92_13395 [Elusimicrobia bacterium]|nr:MAG: hypothetical protein A2016_08410 [Elusimicrobia bacterium GWF2_62_30]HBA61777.1 hypothetical protein [Elusimicrobiota bacterium]
MRKTPPEKPRTASCGSALRALLLAASGPDNLDAFLRRTTGILREHAAIGQQAPLALLLPPGKNTPPFTFSANFSARELKLLAGAKPAKDLLSADIRAAGVKGRLLARIAQPGHRACAGELLNLAARTIAGRLAQESRERQLLCERDIADSVTHLEELFLDFPSISLEAISRAVLDEARRLTGSPAGFAAHIARDTGVLHAATAADKAWANCRAARWVLKNKKVLLTNSAASDPRSGGSRAPVRIEKFVAAPAVSGKKLLGLLALANAPHGYSRAALDAVTKLTRVYSMILRHKMDEQQHQKESVISQALISSSQDIIYAAGPDGKITYISPRVEAYGYRREDLVGHPVFEFVHPDDRGLALRVFSDAMKAGRTLPLLSYRLLRKDGTCFLAEQKSGVVISEGGPALITGVIRDVSPRQEAELALRESEEKYRLLTEGATDIPYSIDADGTLLFIGPQVSRFGLDPGKMIGRPFISYVHPDDRAALLNDFGGSLRTGEIKLSEFRVLDGKGREHWLEELGSARRDEQGAITGFVGIMRDVTERRRMDGLLRQKTAILEAQLNSSLDGIMVMDNSGKRVLQNRRTAELWKIPKRVLDSADSQAQFRHVRRMTKDPEKFAREVARLFKHPGETSRDEVELTDGTVLDRYSAPILDAAGQNLGRIWTFRDISERRKAEAALLDSKRLLESVVENVPLMIFLKEAGDLRFVVFNRAGEKLLGYDRKVLLGSNNLDLFPPEQAAHFMAKDREVLAGKAGFLDIPEEPILTADKGERLLHTRKVCIKGPDGKPLYLLGISEDITERRRLEKLLIESEETLRRIFETATDALFLKDAAGRYVKANRTCSFFFQVDAGKMIGRTAAQLFSPELAAETEREDAEVIKRGRAMVFTKERIMPSGKKLVLNVAKTPMFGPDGKVSGLLGVASDITAIKKMEAEAALAKATDAMSRAARPLAHDFNNALAAINGYATLIDEEMSASNPVKAEIGQIIKAVRRAAEITDKFQSFARNPKLGGQENDKG